MIYQLFVFLLIIGLGALINYPMGIMTRMVINYAVTNYPAYVTGVAVDFLLAIDYWRPLVLVILPALLWFFVNVQRPKPP